MGLDHIRRTYEAFGRDDPLYAVLTKASKRHGGWDPEAFFRTGRDEVEAMLAWVRALGVELRTGRVLDFGCGVGRLSQALAEHFEEVVGVDISRTMVERARGFDRHGSRVRYVVNTRGDLAAFGDDGFDFVYSNITLQHVPPRHARTYIREFFRVLAPAGAAVFQMRNGPRVEPGTLRSWLYRLNREHLRHLLQRLRGRPPYEIHYLARSLVEETIREGGGRVVAVQDVGRGRRTGKSLRYCATA
ncbi:MAG TPA: class I SAM-dependent methyltransferase [Longimicrobiales bacterium]|nr:class I SAM-dependent methyltransferase [Longimicrobiales bacterium]